MNQQSTLASPLSEHLRQSTRPTHQALDDKVMQAQPFQSIESYGKFLCVQHGIHRDVAPLYAMPEVAAIIPNLSQRLRLQAVEKDAADLNITLPLYSELPATSDATKIGIPEAMGWLYVIEGSNLGAAILLKLAKKMGLSETYGARHMAAQDCGRAATWRSFKDGADATELNESERARAVVAAQTAFLRVHSLVHIHLG